MADDKSDASGPGNRDNADTVWPAVSAPSKWRFSGTRFDQHMEAISPFFIAICVPLIISGLGVLARSIAAPNIGMAYLLGVLVVASRFGLWPSVISTVLSCLSLNYLFTEPAYSLIIADSEELIMLSIFLAAAVFTSNLAAKLRRQVEATRLTARRSTNLYDFNRRVSAAVGLDDILAAVVDHIGATVEGRSVVLMPREGGLTVVADYPKGSPLSPPDVVAAGLALESQRIQKRSSRPFEKGAWYFLPMTTGRGPVGILGIWSRSEGAAAVDQSRLLATLADQAAIAIERTGLVADIEKARLAAEAERLRSALLSSLSHDLRTPLASIIGAATSLNDYEQTLSRAERHELAQTIQEEAERLNRFVQNLLDMTRIGAGALRPRADWVDLADVVDAALRRAGMLAARRRIEIDLEEQLPLLHVDALLMEQMLFNLIDNAIKYSPIGTAVRIRARLAGHSMIIAVEDDGPGIPGRDRERVFDMFYRVEAGDSQPAGTGLGLAICRGIVEAHGGTIKALSGPNGKGATIAVALPVKDVPDLSESSTLRENATERA